MARFARIDAPGESFHIISRFVNGEFRIATPSIRRIYLRYLERAVEDTDWGLMSYAAMSSHSHLLGDQQFDRLETLLRSAHGSFARFANDRENRHGPVFSDRATSILVRGDGFRQTLAYIHNNPVRAGLVTNPAHSTWTSHRAYVGLAPRPRWLAAERGLVLAGFDDTPAGRRAFHEFVVEQSTKPRGEQRAARNKERIREQVRRAMNAPAELESPILGSETLEFGIRIPAGGKGLHCAMRWDGSLDRLADFAAHVLGLDRRGANVRERARIHSLALRVACQDLDVRSPKRRVSFRSRDLLRRGWCAPNGHGDDSMRRLPGWRCASARTPDCADRSRASGVQVAHAFSARNSLSRTPSPCPPMSC